MVEPIGVSENGIQRKNGFVSETGKNPSFYRTKSDGKRVCWLAVDANSGEVDYQNSRLKINGDDLINRLDTIENRLERLKEEPLKNALPIGSILLSALSCSKFQESYTGDWMPCHGQNIEGFGALPDLRDRFPRVVDDEEKMLKKQDQSTNRGDLGIETKIEPGQIKIDETMHGVSEYGKANIRLFSEENPNKRRQGGHWQFQKKVNDILKSTVNNKEHTLIGANPNPATLMGHGGQEIFKDAGHTHKVALKLKKTFNVQGASANTILTGGTGETRPKSCYINAFIRVR